MRRLRRLKPLRPRHRGCGTRNSHALQTPSTRANITAGTRKYNRSLLPATSTSPAMSVKSVVVPVAVMRRTTRARRDGSSSAVIRLPRAASDSAITWMAPSAMNSPPRIRDDWGVKRSIATSSGSMKTISVWSARERRTLLFVILSRFSDTETKRRPTKAPLASPATCPKVLQF